MRRKNQESRIKNRPTRPFRLLILAFMAPLGIVLAALWPRAFGRLFLPKGVKGDR
jgi:hypothetical protein